MKIHYIDAQDGTQVPLYWAAAAEPRATLLLQPALGIQAKLYRALAEALAVRGWATAVMEQRGHGLSALRPGYKKRFGFEETLHQDIPAAMAWLEQTVPDKPRLLAGHSLGGHLSTLYAGLHPHTLQGVIHLACAFPFIDDYRGRQRSMLRLLCALMPVFKLVPGYYPGQLMGLGDRESMTMMMQWRQWVTRGSFDFDAHCGLAEAVAEYHGPVLSLSFDRDTFSTEAAVTRALSPFCNATIERVKLGVDEQGTHLGHTGWAKAPDGVVEAIDCLLSRCQI